MDTKRPSVVTIAAILLVVLALFVAGLGIAGQFGLLRGSRQFAAGQFRSRNFSFPNSGTNNGSPVGTLPNSQDGSGTTPTFRQPFGGGTGVTGLSRLVRLFRTITLGLDIVLLILAGLAAFGILKGKRWGVILAIVLAALIILLTIPGMLRIFSALVLVENLIRIALAAAVIVLLLLPVSRKAFAPVDDLDLDV